MLAFYLTVLQGHAFTGNIVEDDFKSNLLKS